jgi:hypothetical protein
VKKKPMTLEELVEKINRASWDGVLFQYRNAEGKEQTEERGEFFAFNSRPAPPETTLSGTPKPARFPFRVENIEVAQIETA